MPGYWWACDRPDCQNHSAQLCFENVVGRGIGVFLWDVLEPKWDQALLVRQCQSCGNNSLRITYDFPRGEPERIRVEHIVGIRREGLPFLQMMWEGIPDGGSGQRWFDFKYTNDRNTQGLGRPCIFERAELRAIFEVYCRVTGEQAFP